MHNTRKKRYTGLQRRTIGVLVGLMLGSASAQARNVGDFFQKVIHLGANLYPGGKEALEAAGVKTPLARQVDRVEQKQDSALERLRAVAKSALEAKQKIETLYYMARHTREQAQHLSEGLKRAKARKFLGAVLEETLGFPVNPAAYVPSIPPTQQLRAQLDWDLSFERSVLREGKYLLSYTRRALLSEKRALDQCFDKRYQKAVAYERDLEAALRAKEQMRLPFYREEITRLDQEMALIEEKKRTKGLSMGEVVCMEQALEQKRWRRQTLDEALSAGLHQTLQLHQEEATALGYYLAERDGAALETHLKQEQQRLEDSYAHLGTW